MPGTEIESSPRASRVIAATMAASAFEIERPSRKPTAASTTTVMPKVTAIHSRTASRVAASAASACLYWASTAARISAMTGSISRNVFIMLASSAPLCCAVSAHAANSDWYFWSLAVISFITAVGTATTSIALENSVAAFFISAMYFGSRRSMKSFSCRRIINIQLVVLGSSISFSLASMSCTAARSEPDKPCVSFSPSLVSAVTSAPKSDA